MTLTYLWHVWPGRHFPASAAEEAQFVADLAQAAGERPSGTVSRAHVTGVLNALRCGLDWGQLRECAPGLAAEKLLGAYEKLEAQRAASVAAWAELVRCPTSAAVATLGPAASRVVPVPVRRLLAAVSETSSGEATARDLDRQTRVVGAVALRLELSLAELAGDEAVRFGRRLYDPYTPGLWGDAHYLPVRVGTLTPVRAEHLLAPSAPAAVWTVVGADELEDTDDGWPTAELAGAGTRGRSNSGAQPRGLQARRARPPGARRS